MICYKKKISLKKIDEPYLAEFIHLGGGQLKYIYKRVMPHSKKIRCKTGSYLTELNDENFPKKMYFCSVGMLN